MPRFLKVIDLAKEYGASVVIGTIDEEGMARTAEGKFKIAKRAYEQATGELGLPASDIFFDPLALPISTGIEEDRKNALETIEGIRTDQDRTARRFYDSWRLKHLVRSQSGFARGSQFGVSARRCRGRSRCSNRQRQQDRAAESHWRTGTEGRASS